MEVFDADSNCQHRSARGSTEGAAFLTTAVMCRVRNPSFASCLDTKK